MTSINPTRFAPILLLFATCCMGGCIRQTIPESYSEQLDAASHDIRMLAIEVADDCANGQMDFISRQGTGRPPQPIRNRVATFLSQVRVRQKQLMSSMPEIVPDELVEHFDDTTEIENLHRATVIEEHVNRRIATTRGGLRFRIANALHFELQQHCADRCDDWTSLVQTQLSTRIAEDADFAATLGVTPWRDYLKSENWPLFARQSAPWLIVLAGLAVLLQLFKWSLHRLRPERSRRRKLSAPAVLITDPSSHTGAIR